MNKTRRRKQKAARRARAWDRDAQRLRTTLAIVVGIRKQLVAFADEPAREITLAAVAAAVEMRAGVDLAAAGAEHTAFARVRVNGEVKTIEFVGTIGGDRTIDFAVKG